MNFNILSICWIEDTAVLTPACVACCAVKNVFLFSRSLYKAHIVLSFIVL